MSTPSVRYVLRASTDGIQWTRLDAIDNRFISVHSPGRRASAEGWLEIAKNRVPAIRRGFLKVRIFEESLAPLVETVVYTAPEKPVLEESVPAKRKRGRPRKNAQRPSEVPGLQGVAPADSQAEAQA